MFRCHLLGLLQKQDLHGYALMKEYRRRSGVQIAPGAIYRELANLVDQGLARRLLDEDPRRTSYRTTARGSVAFDEWFDTVPPATPCPESELAFRLLFFAEVEPQRAARVVELWRQGLWEQTREIEVTLHREAARGASEKDSAVLLLQRRLDHVATDLRFLDSVQETLGLPSVDVGATLAHRTLRRSSSV